MHTTDEPLGSVSRGGVERTPAAVRALGWTSFLTDFSSEAIYPLLPGFVKGLGGTSVEIGLIDGIANAVAAVVRLPSGAVSDAVSPRLALVAGWLWASSPHGPALSFAVTAGLSLAACGLLVAGSRR
jgi:MFS family permease